MALSAQDVKDFLAKWASDYDANSPAFFEHFAPDASIFSLSSPTRIDGREEYKKGFEPYFGSGKRRSQILSPEVKVTGDSAVASFHNRVNIDNRISNLRTTIVVAKDPSGKLQITHLHQSPLGTPAPAAAAHGSGPEAFSLLEERVATAAAAVGTPK